MNITPQGYITRLTDISNKKLQLLGGILNLTRAQSGYINEEELESLEKLIDDKQKLIDAINKLDEEFNVYFQRLKQVLQVKSLDEIKNNLEIPGMRELQEVISKLTSVMTEIDSLEKTNNRKAKELLESLGKEIRTINQGKKVNTAYNPAPAGQPSSFYFDKKK